MRNAITEMTNDVLAREDSALDIFGHPPDEQLPIWLSTEAAELLEWAAGHGEFGAAHAMEWKYPNDEHGSPQRREWFDRAKNELFTHGLIAERGYFAYEATETGRAYVDVLCPPCVIRRAC